MRRLVSALFKDSSKALLAPDPACPAWPSSSTTSFSITLGTPPTLHRHLQLLRHRHHAIPAQPPPAPKTRSFLHSTARCAMIPGFPEDQAEETFKETSGAALGKGLAAGGAACGLNRGLGHTRKEHFFLSGPGHSGARRTG